MVADYENICLDAAYDLGVIQALNDLGYLKAKGQYDKEQQRRMMKKV